MTAHAILSASSSDRWLHCPPSARLNAKVKDQVSHYALEGTEAHALCEYKLKVALGQKAKDPTPDLSMYTKEMEDAANSYVDHILECLEGIKKTTPDPIILIEQKLDFSEFVPEGFGTADCVILADEILHLWDFKYGTGVLVEAEKNSQLMLYGLAATLLFDGIYDFNEVQMTVFQPRRSNISTYRLAKDKLYLWAKETVKPIATLAFEGKGDFASGSWCTFCKVKATCKERARANLELAKYEFSRPPLLSDEEVESILEQLDELTSWAKDIKDYALNRAKSGKKWKGFKLVEGRSNRKYIDDEKVAETVKQAGFDPYEKKLLGITAMTQLLGRKQFSNLLGDLIIKPEGKPTLVPESYKRPEMTNIFDDFKEENIHD
jgi:hypothetical protein